MGGSTLASLDAKYSAVLREGDAERKREVGMLRFI